MRSVPTTALTPKLELAAIVPGANVALAKEAWKVPKQTKHDTRSLVASVIHLPSDCCKDHVERPTW